MGKDWIEWVEPYGPNSEPVYMRVSVKTAVSYQRMKYLYDTDDEALADFMAVNWAYRPKPLLSLSSESITDCKYCCKETTNRFAQCCDEPDCRDRLVKDFKESVQGTKRRSNEGKK